MVAKRSTKMGKIQPYIDVKSKSQIPQFESLIKMGPIIVLVYADWCGHCTRFKKEMWDEVANSSNKTMNTAAVHYDMVNNTSMRNAKIEGYPTLFEVTDKEAPKPIPTPKDKNDLLTLVNSNNIPFTNNTMKSKESEPLQSMNMNNTMMKSERMTANAARATSDTFEPMSLDSLPPSQDLDMIKTNNNPTSDPSSMRGGAVRGGSLLETLLKVTADTAHVALLATSAAELSKRYKKHKKSRRAKNYSGKKRATRRS